MLTEIKTAVEVAAEELVQAAKLKSGQIVVVGCSTSEIAGKPIGRGGSAEIGECVFEALNRVFSQNGIILAAQCCEHLNRAIIIERVHAADFEIVNAVPTPEAGGAFAAAAFAKFKDPVALEEFRADAGLDVGGTLIAMHLKKVAVPLRLNTVRIGSAAVMAARTRPKLVGGVRARYDERDGYM